MVVRLIDIQGFSIFQVAQFFTSFLNWRRLFAKEVKGSATRRDELTMKGRRIPFSLTFSSVLYSPRYSWPTNAPVSPLSIGIIEIRDSLLCPSKYPSSHGIQSDLLAIREVANKNDFDCCILSLSRIAVDAETELRSSCASSIQSTYTLSPCSMRR